MRRGNTPSGLGKCFDDVDGDLIARCYWVKGYSLLQLSCDVSLILQSDLLRFVSSIDRGSDTLIEVEVELFCRKHTLSGVTLPLETFNGRFDLVSLFNVKLSRLLLLNSRPGLMEIDRVRLVPMGLATSVIHQDGSSLSLASPIQCVLHLLHLGI